MKHVCFMIMMKQIKLDVQKKIMNNIQKYIDIWKMVKVMMVC